jgi:hypothetical protein
LIIQERKHSVSTNKEIDAESGSKTRAKKIDPTPECPEILNYLSLTPDPTYFVCFRVGRARGFAISSLYTNVPVYSTDLVLLT